MTQQYKSTVNAHAPLSIFVLKFACYSLISTKICLPVNSALKLGPVAVLSLTRVCFSVDKLLDVFFFYKVGMWSVMTLKDPSWKMPLLISVTLHAAQQLSGINAVSFCVKGKVQVGNMFNKQNIYESRATGLTNSRQHVNHICNCFIFYFRWCSTSLKSLRKRECHQKRSPLPQLELG